MNADALVRARIPQDTKDRAMAALDKMGLSTSDVIRLVMMRIAEEGRLPFDVRTPNTTTRRAIAQLESGKCEWFERADDLFDDLGI